jgi:hypothetical protein
MFLAAHRSSSEAVTVFAASGLSYLIAVCKPEAAYTVRAPDDGRCAARNMLSLQ